MKNYLLIIGLMLFCLRGLAAPNEMVIGDNKVSGDVDIAATMSEVLTVTDINNSSGEISDISFAIKNPALGGAYSDTENLCVHSNSSRMYKVKAESDNSCGFCLVNKHGEKIYFKLGWFSDEICAFWGLVCWFAPGSRRDLTTALIGPFYLDNNKCSSLSKNYNARLEIKLDSGSVKNAAAGLYRAHVIIHVTTADNYY